MIPSSLKLAMVAISLSTFAVACSHSHDEIKSRAVTPSEPGALVYQHSQDNAAKLTAVFTQIDPSYDFENRILTNKIEGLDLISVYEGVPTVEGIGYAKATLLVKGVDKPVSLSSAKIVEADLSSGKIVNLTVGAESKAQVEEVVGGPLTVSLKCLDSDCKQVAIYLRIYQGAGYIFEQKDGGGFQMVNSIGPAGPIDQAIALRGIRARNT